MLVHTPFPLRECDCGNEKGQGGIASYIMNFNTATKAISLYLNPNGVGPFNLLSTHQPP